MGARGDSILHQVGPSRASVGYFAGCLTLRPPPALLKAIDQSADLTIIITTGQTPSIDVGRCDTRSACQVKGSRMPRAACMGSTLMSRYKHRGCVEKRATVLSFSQMPG